MVQLLLVVEDEDLIVDLLVAVAQVEVELLEVLELLDVQTLVVVVVEVQEMFKLLVVMEDLV